MDYPDYLRIKARNRGLGLLWMLGDLAYYFGLLGGCGLIGWSAVATVVGGLGWLLEIAPDQSVRYLRPVPVLLACVAACVAANFGGHRLKRFARRHSGLFEDEQ